MQTWQNGSNALTVWNDLVRTLPFTNQIIIGHCPVSTKTITINKKTKRSHNLWLVLNL